MHQQHDGSMGGLGQTLEHVIPATHGRAACKLAFTASSQVAIAHGPDLVVQLQHLHPVHVFCLFSVMGAGMDMLPCLWGQYRAGSTALGCAG